MAVFPQHLRALADTVLQAARSKGVLIATAESCTGGLISACLTEIPGGSDVFDCGFVVYSYESKTASLGVPAETIKSCGAVSPEVAEAMAKGALRSSRAAVAVSATGIAGPGGGTPDKPVGLVWIGIANGRSGKSRGVRNVFDGDRAAVRLHTVEAALMLLKEEIEGL